MPWWTHVMFVVVIALILALLYRHFMLKGMTGIYRWVREIRENARREVEQLEKEFAEAQKSGDELKKFEISQRIYDLKQANNL